MFAVVFLVTVVLSPAFKPRNLSEQAPADQH
jgi:hypothetical protein